MWHVETDYFSLAIFLIMVIKNRLLRKERKDFQSDVFYLVLIISIITNIVDILASLSMNYADNWWVYQITMTLYVASMPLLAAVWTCYAYVLIYAKELSVKRIWRNVSFILLPYAVYALSALTNPVTGLYFGLTPYRIYQRSAVHVGRRRVNHGVFSCRADNGHRQKQEDTAEDKRTAVDDVLCDNCVLHMDTARKSGLADNQRKLCAGVYLVRHHGRGSAQARALRRDIPQERGA